MVPLLFLLFAGAAAAPNAESLYREAQAAFARGEVKRTVDLAGAALKQLGESDSELAWRVRILYADGLFSGASHDEGRAILDRPLPAKLQGSDIEVLRLRGLAVAAIRKRDRATSQPLIRNAYALAKKHPRTLPSVLLALAMSDTAKSDVWLREALSVSRKYKDVANELRALGTIGFMLANDARFDEAIDIWEPALERARSLRNESTIQKLEGNLGWAYLELGDYESASSYFTSALARATRLGAAFELVPWTFQLGNVRLHNGDFEGARKHYRAAYDLAVQKYHPQKGIALTYLANEALATGRLAEARGYANAALEERKKEKEPALRCQLLNSRIDIAEGKLDEAGRTLKAILASTESEQTKWEAQATLARLHVKKGNAAAAEEAFRDAVKTVRGMRADVSGHELRFAFFTSMTELFDSYIDFLIAQDRDVDALNVTEIARAQTLEEGLNDVVERRDVRTVARDTGATILCYWLGGARSYLWIVTPKNVEAVELPSKKKIEAVVNAYQNNLLSGAMGSLNQSGTRGAQLWKMLVGPASQVITPRSRVIIVPDGRLHAFNMETLVVSKPRPHYWIEDVVISTAGSLGLLVRKDTPRNTAPRLLLVGNPPQPSREFTALPRAGLEIDRVKKHFAAGRATILSGAKATPSAYRSASPETFTHLHFVAHGVPTRLKPLDSAVVLAREGDTFKLYARDIAKQPLNARLVTISSCHGAGTRAYAGEGLVGLGWAFLRAGADNVIAALWEVSDAATPELMDAFYARLVKDADPATALREAKLSLIRKGGAYSRPRYWAPFLLYGSS